MADPPRYPGSDPDPNTAPKDDLTLDVADDLRGDVIGRDPERWPGRPLFQPGEEVADRFRIVDLIARGGMGEVYEAEDLDLGVSVALKVLRSGLAADSEAEEYLRHEIHLTRQVAHPNVCRVYDVLRLRLPGRGRTAIGFTMELLHGETLADRIRRCGRLGPDDALPLIRQMAAALDAAHRSGVVHRDFKSGNVLLVDDRAGGDRVVVTDFGVARPVAGESVGEQGPPARAEISGTPDYMAPEQAQGSEVDSRSDIYALGVVIYEMMTGTRPHDGETPMALLLNRLRQAPPSPRVHLPDLDPRWEQAVLRCLAVDPERRTASASEVVAELTAVAGGDRSGGVPSGGPSEVVEPDPISRTGLQTVPLIWRRRAAIAIAAVACAAILVSARILTGRGDRPSPTLNPGPVQLTTWPGLEIDPVLSPRDDSVAFASNRSGRFEIYVKQLGPGSQETALTSDGAQNFQPAWSPDGRWIAYASHGRRGIWLVPAEGGQPRQLTDFGSHPSWSPDGSLVAFQEASTAELSANAVTAFPPSTLWLVGISGGLPWQLTRPGVPVGGHGDPQFSPDGRRVVFTASDRRWAQIWSVDVSGGELQPMVVDPPVACDPVCSPDLQWLYFAAVSAGERYGLWRVRLAPETGLPAGDPAEVVRQGIHSMRQFSLAADGCSLIHTSFSTVSNLQTLPLSQTTGVPLGESTALTSGSGRNSRPAFSPDGRWIALDRWNVGMSQDIWMMNGDGSSALQLTLHPANDTQASWLPDGTAVTFSSDRNKQWSLYSARVDGAAEENLAVLENMIDAIRLSPDGTAIAYHAPGAGGIINLWVAAVDGSGTRQLSFDSELIGFPCWSPDGEVLAAERRRGEDDHVVLVDVESGSITQLTTARGKHWPYSWSPDGDRVAFASLRDGYWNIWWVSRSTGTEQQLTSFKGLNAYVRYPAWSPRGDEIVYEYAETVGDLWLLEGLETE